MCIRDSTSTTQNKIRRIEFQFDPVSQSGGFHRLLLSAVAQFHGIKARGKNRPETRALFLEARTRVQRDEQEQQQQQPIVLRLLSVLAQQEEAGRNSIIPSVSRVLRTTSSVGDASTDDFTLVDGAASESTYVLVSSDDDDECLDF